MTIRSGYEAAAPSSTSLIWSCKRENNSRISYLILAALLSAVEYVHGVALRTAAGNSIRSKEDLEFQVTTGTGKLILYRGKSIP